MDPTGVSQVDMAAEAVAAGNRAVELDPHQRRVVDHNDGPLLAVGGPGSGKSTVLEERFLSLASQEGCSADRILFLVPNRAQKMALRDRLTRRLLSETGITGLIEVPVYTWHGLAHHLVTRHYDRLAYTEPPVLLTSPEQWGDVRDALNDEQEVDWPHHKHLLANRGFVDEVVDFCIRAQQRLLDDGQLDALANARPAWRDVVTFFKKYRSRLRLQSRVDYPTLLGEAVDLVANHDDLRDSLHHRFLHILVDDGQELALVQQRLLHFLAVGGPPGRSLALAGDPDSAIETFRGAEPDWIEDFEKEFGAHESVVLETCYRLGEDFGAKIKGLIGRNGEGDHRPRSFAGAAEVEVQRFTSLASEMEAIARQLRLAHLQDGVPYEEMAILMTSPRSMLPPLERALDALELPFTISAPDRPLGREPIVRAFADLATFSFDGDDIDAEQLTQLLRSPLIDLEDDTIRELEREARRRGIPLAKVVEDGSPSIASDEAGKLVELRELRDLLAAKKDAPADEAFWVVWDRATKCRDLLARAAQDIHDQAHRDLDALVAFSRALGRFVERRPRRVTFRDYMKAIGRADFGSDPWLPPERSRGGVNVLSFHGAKGKEWRIAAVAGVIEGAIPKGRRATGLFDPYFLDETDPAKRARKNEAEDRRVLYVALSRATERCIVTTSPGSSRRGEPSRFIEELTGEVPEVIQQDDLPPLTFAEAAARYRRTISDTTRPAPERVAALAAVKKVCELDPGCGAAQPSEWWWRWDWTDQPLSIREQQQDTSDDLPLDKLRTSYSRISTYDNCGLQYLLGVVLGLDPDSSHNMAFGSVVHRVFEEIERSKLSPADAYRLYDELFEKIKSQFPNKPIERQFHRDGQLMIEKYGTYLKPGTAAMIEKDFKVDLEGHRITGRIDRIDNKGGNLTISDYKTSSSALGWQEAKESLQLAIYYLAARNDPEIAALGKPVFMKLLYPKLPVTKDGVQFRYQNPEQAEAALERLPELMEGVLAEDFRPDPTADCMWCRFKPLCPLWSEGKELPP
ncbi:MAG TPA: ATP-dependent DNA helicase [Actinomycetota bacterium]|nr:ATP-dependent DNA helicase [Actinomycetota bacterium]